jgi:hypothetical protein
MKVLFKNFSLETIRGSDSRNTRGWKKKLMEKKNMYILAYFCYSAGAAVLKRKNFLIVHHRKSFRFPLFHLFALPLIALKNIIDIC